MESILTSIKKLLGIEADVTHFDPDIITHLNSVFMRLKQLGVGPEDGFFIEDDTATWSDFIADPMECQAVKTYISAKTRLIFDPPQSSTIMKCLEEIVREFEWCLNVEAESSY